MNAMTSLSPDIQAIVNAAVAAALAQAGVTNQPAASKWKPVTVAELAGDYLEYAQGYYVKGGKPTGEHTTIGYAVRHLVREFGDMQVSDFGAAQMRKLQAVFVGHGWARKTVNAQTRRVVRMLRWGVAEGRIDPAVLLSAQSVPGLKQGRTAAAEYDRIQPVPESSIDAIRPHVSPVVMAMVDVQRLSGMRPGEVCKLRTCDIDQSREVWEYRPRDHKTAHHGRSRVILFGPRAQEVLSPWMKPDDQEAPIFSPRESERIRAEKRRQARVTPLPAAEQGRALLGGKSDVGPRYSSAAYRKAVERACIRAGIAPWHPNQLRHLAATNIRREFGIEVARAVLGHSCVQMTEIYAEMDMDKAREAMQKLG